MNSLTARQKVIQTFDDYNYKDCCQITFVGKSQEHSKRLRSKGRYSSWVDGR